MPPRGLSAALLFVFAALVVTFPLTNTDIWWHLAAGREILEHGFPHADPFSTGAHGQAWIDVHWLFQLLALGVFRLGGVAGLVIVKGLICAGAALVLLRAADRQLQPLVLLALGLLLFLTRHLVLARPIVLTLLYLSCFLLVLERLRAGARPRILLWLLPVQALWANTQGLFLLGPVLAGCYLAGEGAAALAARWSLPGFARGLPPRSLRWLALALPALVLCCLATPYGLRGLELPLTLFGRIDPLRGELFAYNVSENVPPWLLERSGGIAHFKWVGAVAFASFLLAVRRGVVLARFFALSALFLVALMANRNLLLFYWVAGLVVPLNLAALVRRRIAAALPAVSAVGIVGLALLARSAAADEGSIAEPAPFRVPRQATARLERLPGKIFNSVRYGGYLIWRLHPRRRPFIDGRLVIRTPAQFAEHLELLDRPGHAFGPFRRRNDIRVALLPTAYPESYLRLVVHLYRDPTWRLVYTDGTETLFHWGDGRSLDLGRRETIRTILGELRARHGGNPAVHERALGHLGRLLAEVGHAGRAVELLEPLQGRRSRALLARALFLAGDTTRARRLSRRLLARDPGDANSLLLLARIEAAEGRHRQALQWLRRCLALDPHDRQARRLLERITEHLDR